MDDTVSVPQLRKRAKLKRPPSRTRGDRRGASFHVVLNPTEDGKRLGARLAADFRRKVEGLVTAI